MLRIRGHGRRLHRPVDVDAHGTTTPTWRARGAAVLGRVRAAARRPTVRPWLVAGGGLVFVALVVSSFRALPDDGRDARPALVAVLVLVTTPATVVLNALEYRFMASTLGHHVTIRHAVRVSLVAAIANYLPAPGGVAVRTVALKQRGATVRSAVSINVLAGLVWAGVTGLAAGGALVRDDELAGRAALAMAGGIAALVVSVVLLQRGGAGWHRRFGQVFVIELGLVLISGMRVWVSLAAIGEAAGFGAAIAISGSTILAAAVGVFPAGLGLRELLAGGIAAAVGVPVAAAVAASAVERVAAQVGAALTALVMGVRPADLRRGSAATDELAAGDGAGLPDNTPPRGVVVSPPHEMP